MSGFTYDAGRIMKFYGTAGQIDLDEGCGTIEIKVFGKEKEVVQISSLVDAIGVSAAGVIVENKPMVSSIFIKVPKDNFDLVKGARQIFESIGVYLAHTIA